MKTHVVDCKVTTFHDTTPGTESCPFWGNLARGWIGACRGCRGGRTGHTLCDNRGASLAPEQSRRLRHRNIAGINMGTSARVITALCSHFLLCWTATGQPAFQHHLPSPPPLPSPPGFPFIAVRLCFGGQNPPGNPLRLAWNRT